MKLALIKLKKLRDPGSSPATLVADAEELNAEELNEIIAEDFDEAILEACAEQADEAIEARLEARKLFELGRSKTLDCV